MDHPLGTDERISLITDIFGNNKIEMVERLCEDDAQSFVDVVDEVLSIFLSQETSLT